MAIRMSCGFDHTSSWLAAGSAGVGVQKPGGLLALMWCTKFLREADPSPREVELFLKFSLF